MQSTEYTYQLSHCILKKHMDNKTKINRGQETHYISVYTKFEEFILIHEAMNAEQGHYYLNSFGKIQIVLIGTRDGQWFCLL